IGQSLSEQLGQSFVVENRSGASSNIATDAVARASPDGYTLLLITSTNAINTTLYDKLSFDFIRDIVPIASIARVPLVMEVHPSVPARTVPEHAGQCEPCRCQLPGAARQSRRDRAAGLARRFRQAYRRRDHEMGQGDPG